MPPRTPLPLRHHDPPATYTTTQVALPSRRFLGATERYTSWHRFSDFETLHEQVASPQLVTLGLGASFPVPKARAHPSSL